MRKAQLQISVDQSQRVYILEEKKKFQKNQDQCKTELAKYIISLLSNVIDLWLSEGNILPDIQTQTKILIQEP